MTNAAELSSRHETAIAAVLRWAQEAEIEVERVDSNRLFTMLEGVNKRTIPVLWSAGDHSLTVRSHFMQAPEENCAELYGMLLARHRLTYTLRFAIVPDGDVMLIGLTPLKAVTAEEVDRIAGAMLTTADETYNAALRLGFESYIAREQRWREALGLGRNPIS